MAALIIPSGPVDVLRDCWRRVVFRVDCRSATAVSAIMLKELTEKEILTLIEDFNTAAAVIPDLNVRRFWSAEHSELLGRMSPEFARLHKLVEKYRLLHADQLYQQKMVDVDICFEHATLGTYEDDVQKMRDNNVRIYHFWPESKGKGAPTWPQRLRISVIGKAKTIDELYLEREANGEVEIAANTKPFPLSPTTPSEPSVSPRLRPGKMFPYELPDLGKLPMAALDPAARETIRKRIDEICSMEPEHSILSGGPQKENGRRWHPYGNARWLDPSKPLTLEESAELMYQPPPLEFPGIRHQSLDGPENIPSETQSKYGKLRPAKAAFKVNCEKIKALHLHIAFLRRHQVFSADREADESTLEGISADLDRLSDETEDLRLRVVDLDEQIAGTGWSRPGDLVFDLDEEPIDAVLEKPSNVVPDEDECPFKIHADHCRPWWPGSLDAVLSDSQIGSNNERKKRVTFAQSLVQDDPPEVRQPGEETQTPTADEQEDTAVDIEQQECLSGVEQQEIRQSVSEVQRCDPPTVEESVVSQPPNEQLGDPPRTTSKPVQIQDRNGGLSRQMRPHGLRVSSTTR